LELKLQTKLENQWQKQTFSPVDFVAWPKLQLGVGFA
jgi:hypothetical protein